ncbi:hypothetical protein OTAKU_00390 [Serratia phage vB_SmaM-Otaku]|uniref:DUF7740 domain-containing protein n=1 Tax=Serratia phage vB_SmaM-Otaku TaxID=2932867 RepID=A0AAE9HGY0_9CAUD|nr:hypothetical protein PF631_gp39 [Serratia phage vB_SmaM-Otaku]UPU16028.1 hypothetical protein OTAKU_00390 [Serratia phage vB_SmaM-Otaku]
MQTQAEQYLDALVSLELAAKMAERDCRPVNAAIRAACSALQRRITDSKILLILRGLAAQTFPAGALAMMRRQHDSMVGG